MYFVYFLTSKQEGTIYIGVTNNLIKRCYEHKNKITKGFTSKFKVDRLVYFEQYSDISLAIAREKQLKNWKRIWKIGLIERDNPTWDDLYFALCV